MEDFMLRALLGGVGVAVVAGPLGCIVVWRRMAYFGAALAHSALLGIALGFLLGVDPTWGILGLCLVLALGLTLLERQQALHTDTLLGIIAHSALALGLVVMAFMPGLRVDLMGYLFGDVLAIGSVDLVLVGALVLLAAVSLGSLWRPLLSMIVSEELAAVEGVPVRRIHLAFVLMVAAVIAVGMKVVGILLVVSLLIIPAAAARRWSATPEQMALGAAFIGVLAVVLGLFGSLRWDVPAGPAIVVVATVAFLAGLPGAVRTRPGSGPGAASRWR